MSSGALWTTALCWFNFNLFIFLFISKLLSRLVLTLVLMEKNSRIWLDFAFLPSCYVVFVFSLRCSNCSDSLTLSEHPDSHVSHAWGKKHVLCFQGNLIRIVGFELDFHSTRSRSCKQPTLHVLKGHSSPCESDCLSFPTYHSCSLYRWGNKRR